MELIRRRRRRKQGIVLFSDKATLLCCSSVLLLLSFLVLLSTACNEKSCLEVRSSSAAHSQPQRAKARRLSVAGGPGSFPPHCAAKCGACTPCFPVHIAVPPGKPAIEEYYPEAWRCRCGNKLYMP